MACQFQRCFTRQVLLHFTCFFLSEASFIPLAAHQVLLCLACLFFCLRQVLFQVLCVWLVCCLQPDSNILLLPPPIHRKARSSTVQILLSILSYLSIFFNYIILSIPFSTSISSTSSSNQSSSSFVIFRSARTSCTTSGGWVRPYAIKIWTPIYRHTCLMNH